jgi:exopolyphosphatase/guanosine-5'-triphosphate,3'-diphosphate pyrophosphatase
LARIAGAAPSSEGFHVRRTLARDDVHLWVPKLADMTAAERSRLPGVSESRAPQLLAGAIVAEAAMDLLGVDQVEIGPWALREGVILRRIDWLDS